jgi:hypothetical protein
LYLEIREIQKELENTIDEGETITSNVIETINLLPNLCRTIILDSKFQR